MMSRVNLVPALRPQYNACLVLFVILFLATQTTNAYAQDTNPSEMPTNQPATPPEQMSNFARMEAGKWQLGTVHASTWEWGPGHHSIHAHTVGSDADANPWRALVIYYWHPDHAQIHSLSFHPDIPGIGRGVGEGTFEFDGENAIASVNLHQPRARRTLASRWTFKDPDNYHEVLLEDNGQGQVPLAEWDYVRSMEQSAPPLHAPAKMPTPSKNIQAFVPLLGQWESREDDRGEILVHANFVWMEYLDVVALRVEGGSKPDDHDHLLNAYFYHHVGTNELRCLALSASGGVYEGRVTVLKDHDLELDLTRYKGETDERRLVRFDFESDGTLRTRQWSIADNDRALMFDVTHQRTPKPQED
jgi:hypothetical protein